MPTDIYLLRFPDGGVTAVNPEPGSTPASADLSTWWSNRWTGRRDIRKRLAGVPSHVVLQVAELDGLAGWARKEMRAIAARSGAADGPAEVAGPDSTTDRFGRREATRHYYGRAGETVHEIDVLAYCNAGVEGHAEAVAMVTALPGDLKDRVDDLLSDWRPAPEAEVTQRAAGVYDRLAGWVSRGHRVYPNSLGGPFDHDAVIHSAFNAEKPHLDWLLRHGSTPVGLAGEAVQIVARLSRVINLPHQAYPNSLGGGASHDAQIHAAFTRESSAMGVIKRSAGLE